MTNIDLYYLAKIHDGQLELTIHATAEDRDNAVTRHIGAAADLLGVSHASFNTIIELEELYEQRTGKQMELLTGTATVPNTHPVFKRVKSHIESAITTLDALSILSPSARAELVAALTILGQV